jgi:hypothetical protein
MFKSCCGSLCVLCTCAALVPLAAGATISTESLLKEMANLERLTTLPDPPYTCRQFSSYYRESKSPDDPKGWFANADSGQFLREEDNGGRKEFVMMDIDGPGAIVRIWSANPDAAGTVRVYLDGDASPVIETPLKTLLGGTYPGLISPLAGEASRGWNLYFPIPYAKHCKVTADQKKFYYHINYRTYPSGTRVETLGRKDLESIAGKTKAVAEQLDSGLRRTQGSPKVDGFRETLAPGEEKIVASLDGARVIILLRMTLEAASIPVAARGVVMTIHFDGEETVATPVGDFFACAPGLIPYKSLPFINIADKNGRVFGQSAWWMPFSKRAEIRLKNDSGQEVKVEGTIASEAYKWSDRSLLFHAKWRIQRDIPTRPFIDWTHLECTGEGRFVGGHLHLINPTRTWWGEGDEKIYVDGETFPSTFGTGSEDYYGYAWGDPAPFMHAYHNQVHVDGPKTYGNVSNSRFHIFDDIPFTRSFKFDMENWDSVENVKITRAAVSYWYARPGGKDFFKPITADDVQYTEVPPYQVHRVAGVIEGESLKLKEKTAGDVRTQDLNEKFSGEKVLRWDAGKPGDKLTLVFESPKSGPQELVVHLAKASDFGQVQFYVNGQKAGPVIDAFSQRLSATDEISLGKFDLRRGENGITIEITGANPAAKNHFSVGLDYILIR